MIRRHKSRFTLVELTLVVVILGILAALAIRAYLGSSHPLSMRGHVLEESPAPIEVADSARELRPSCSPACALYRTSSVPQ